MSQLTKAFLYLGLQQAQSFKSNPEVYLELLVTAPSQRSIMFNVYAFLKSSGKIRSIELLPETEKRDIYEEAKKLAKGRLPVENLVRLSKALYVLNWLLEN